MHNLVLNQDFLIFKTLNRLEYFAILIILALWLLAIKSIFQSLKYYGAIITVIIITAFIWGLLQYKLINVGEFEQTA